MTLVAAWDLTSASDADLARALTDRSDDAMAEVHRRYAGLVRAVARRTLSSDDLAEEAVQDVFLSLWLAPERFDAQRGSLRSYLAVQAQRRAIDIARSEAARHRREVHDARRDVRRAGDVESDVLAAATAHEVHVALAELHPRERQALELAYLEGHSYRQVARLLGQPEGTIKNRIRAALARLRGLLPAAGSPLSELPLA